jgi:hypothetical protein
MKKAVLIVGIILSLATTALLCRTWTWSVPVPTTFTVMVADTWTDEQPRTNDAGVWSEAMPELTQRINSESFLARLKSKLPHHSVVSHWTPGNTNLRPAQLSPGGPLIIHCSTLTYGVRRWSLFGHGWGLDEKRTEPLKLDLQVALKELLNRGAH